VKNKAGRKKMNRLSALLAAATIALGLGQTTALADDAVSIRLSWSVAGYGHASFYLGRERGFFKDVGIDLTIREGRGSVAAAQAVAAGEDTFGISAGDAIVTAVARGLPIKAIMTHENVSGYAVITRRDSGISTLKDLDGKIVATTPGDGPNNMFRAVMAANDIDPTKVRMLNIDPAGKIPLLVEKRADAILGGVQDQPQKLDKLGIPNLSLPFYEAGVTVVGQSILTSKKLINDNPELIARFATAALKSFAAASEDPEATVAAVVASVPEVNPDVLLKQIQIDVSRLALNPLKGKPIGYPDMNGWQKTVGFMKQYADLPSSVNVSDVVTCQFVDNVEK
jgi:NitT/TauT family transport system substrate-binding protein